jgi:hypothetical protein
MAADQQGQPSKKRAGGDANGLKMDVNQGLHQERIRQSGTEVNWRISRLE